MKKLILILLFLTGFLNAQTQPSPTYNVTTTNTLKIKTPATVTSVNFLPAFSSDGITISKIDPVNLGFASDANVLHKNGNETKTDILTIANQLNFAPISANSTNGYILKDGQPYIHNFYVGTNPLTPNAGNNTNIGVNSGNFNSDNYNYASTMVGFETGKNNKNGYSNVGIGYRNLTLNENGFGNSGLGTYVLGNLNGGTQNTSVGWHSMLYSTTASENSSFGVEALWNNLTGARNTAIGMRSGVSNTGSDNVFLGYMAGSSYTGSNALFIGNNTRTLIQGDFTGDGFLLLNGAGEFRPSNTRKIKFSAVSNEAALGWTNNLDSPANAYLDAFDYRFRTGGTVKLQISNNGDLAITTKASAGSAATSANDLMRKGETDTALNLKANLASPVFTGVPAAPTAAPGTNTTQLATTAFVTSASRPYKVYTALLNQTGTSAPTVIVLENTLSGTPVWTYSSAGNFIATLNGAFPLNKTFLQSTKGSGAPGYSKFFSGSVNQCFFSNYDSTGANANGLNAESIEIRVYP